MTIDPITDAECHALLARSSFGRLGCSRDAQPYIVPVFLAYESESVYVFSTFGQKIEWMRLNPKVCVQVDEIEAAARWVSVIANGTYQELPEDEHQHARRLLGKHHDWWLNALAERRATVNDLSVDPLFFRIHIESMTGLRATDKDDAPR